MQIKEKNDSRSDIFCKSCEATRVVTVCNQIHTRLKSDVFYISIQIKNIFHSIADGIVKMVAVGHATLTED